MSDWAMREYAEEDGFGRWPKRLLGGRRDERCRSQVRGVLDDQQEHVRQYLELLRAGRGTTAPGPNDDAAWADAEVAFTEVAKAFGRRHGIEVETWVAVRVPLDVLRRAGFRLPDATESSSSPNSPR